MSHISTGVEYGLHCLLYLVDLPKDFSNPSVRDLAELQGVPVEYLAKIFTKLRKANLVSATEGSGGGYRLARPGEHITVLDVVRAVDGRKPLYHCKEIRARCAVFNGRPPSWATQGACRINSIMYEAQKRLEDSLAMYTLADLTAGIIANSPAEHQSSVVSWLNNRRQ
jgi:Rrf2 family protein